MPRYAVLQNYGSSAYGPWEQGSQVELDEDQAAWVNRDSPGTLARVKAGVHLEIGRPVPTDKLLTHEQPEPPPTHAVDPAQQPGPPQPPSPPPAERSAPAPPAVPAPGGRSTRAAGRGTRNK